MTLKLFLTYNPYESIERNTALRLQTLATLYEIQVELPSRLADQQSFSMETQQRIARADAVVAFALHSLSPVERQELEYAIQQQKNIILLHVQGHQPSFTVNNYPNCKYVAVNFQHTEQALHEIADFLRNNVPPASSTSTAAPVTEHKIDLTLGLLGIGLGMLALWALSKKDS